MTDLLCLFNHLRRNHPGKSQIIKASSSKTIKPIAANPLNRSELRNAVRKRNPAMMKIMAGLDVFFMDKAQSQELYEHS